MAVSHPTPARSSSCCCFRTQGCLPMPMRLWWGPELVFSLSVCPLRRKCASSLKRRTSKRGGCSRSVCWYSGRVYSLGSCWPGFEPRESALCMETVSGRYEGLSSYNSWKSPLHVTTVWWTFVVTVPNESSSPAHVLAVKRAPLWVLLLTATLPESLNVCIRLRMVLQCGGFTLGICDGIASGQYFWKIQGFWSAVEHKIVSQSPSRCQMELVAALYVSPGNIKKPFFPFWIILY